MIPKLNQTVGSILAKRAFLGLDKEAIDFPSKFDRKCRDSIRHKTWDRMGIPTLEKLRKLHLEDIVTDMEKYMKS
jgi:hypothetical protein